MNSFDDSEALERYLEKHSSPESEVLKDLDRFTHLNMVHPQMMSGHILGGFLRMISRMIHPGHILEIGTFTGYSAICLAEGLKDNGRLVTIEINDELAEVAAKFIKQAGYEDRVDLLVGDALEIVPRLDREFDLVFIDASKEHYTACFNLVIDKVTPGGYIVADNVLWGGKVLDDSAQDSATRAIREFNQYVTKDPRVENVLLPIRDGIMLLKKV